MKAEFMINKNGEVTDLTLGRIYDVLSENWKRWKGERKIQIRNDNGVKSWYDAECFLIRNEAKAFIDNDAAADADQPTLADAAAELSKLAAAAGVTVDEAAAAMRRTAETLAERRCMEYGA